MIEKTSSYKTKDGHIYATLEEAQKAAIGEIIGVEMPSVAILKNADAVITILKLKPRKAKVAKKQKPAVKAA
jgi:hypothetical protein